MAEEALLTSPTLARNEQTFSDTAALISGSGRGAP
jgi:hypothetical protein